MLTYLAVARDLGDLGSLVSFGAENDPAERFGYIVGTLACPMTIGVIAVAGIVWAVWYYRR